MLKPFASLWKSLLTLLSIVACLSFVESVGKDVGPSALVRWLAPTVKEKHVEEACYGLECFNRIWCFDGPRRHIDFSKIFSAVEFEASFPGDTAPCVLIESEDTFLKFSSFNSSDDVIGRIERKRAEGFSVKRKLTAAFGIFSPCEEATCSKLVSPYGRSCLSLCGQTVSGEVKVSATYYGFKMKYMAFLLIGILIFLSAPALSKQIVFYYTFGTSLGMVLSVFLIVFFVMKRFLPKNNSVFSLLMATMAQSLFGVLSHFRGWWQMMLEDHIEYVVAYLLLTSTVSFAFSHWLLKGSNGVSVGAGLQDIVRIGIRIVGTIFMMFSSQSLSWSIAVAALISITALTYSPMISLQDMIKDRLDPKRGVAEMEENFLYGHRFQSVEEFEMNSKIETERQMKLLVQNPEFQQWAIRNAGRISVGPSE